MKLRYELEQYAKECKALSDYEYAEKKIKAHIELALLEYEREVTVLFNRTGFWGISAHEIESIMHSADIDSYSVVEHGNTIRLSVEISSLMYYDNKRRK